MGWRKLPPEGVPGLLPPLDDAPPVDQVEHEEEEGEEAEEDHVGPGEPLLPMAGPLAAPRAPRQHLVAPTGPG